MVQSKNQARVSGRQYRQSLSDQEYDDFSSAITDKFFQSFDFKSHKKVHIYRSITKNKEVSTNEIISKLRQNSNVDLYVQNLKPEFPDSMFDMVIIPCLAIDAAGNRVGYGQGGYDRFLAEQTQATIIALCFNGQVMQSIDSNEHDIMPEYAITEKQILSFT